METRSSNTSHVVHTHEIEKSVNSSWSHKIKKNQAMFVDEEEIG